MCVCPGVCGVCALVWVCECVVCVCRGARPRDRPVGVCVVVLVCVIVCAAVPVVVVGITTEIVGCTAELVVCVVLCVCGGTRRGTERDDESAAVVVAGLCERDTEGTGNAHTVLAGRDCAVVCVVVCVCVCVGVCVCVVGVCNAELDPLFGCCVCEFELECRTEADAVVGSADVLCVCGCAV